MSENAYTLDPAWSGQFSEFGLWFISWIRPIFRGYVMFVSRRAPTTAHPPYLLSSAPSPPGWWGKRHGSPTSAPCRKLGDIKLPVEKGWEGTLDGPLLYRNGVLMGFSCKYTYHNIPVPWIQWKELLTCVNWKSQWMESQTLQGTNISHLGKRKIIFKMPFLGDMLVPWRVSLVKFPFMSSFSSSRRIATIPTDFSSDVVWCCLEDHLS